MQENYNLVSCKVCGKQYKACKNCEEQRGMGAWRAICDTAEHYKIYMTALAYEFGNITEDVAREQLSRCDLSGIENFEPTVKVVLDKILHAGEEE